MLFSNITILNENLEIESNKFVKVTDDKITYIGDVKPEEGYSREYDEYIKQYTVTKPEYSEDGKSEDIYQTLFGSDGE